MGAVETRQYWQNPLRGVRGALGGPLFPLPLREGQGRASYERIRFARLWHWRIMLLVKSRVYIETTVVSYLKSDPSSDFIVAAHQEITRKWWSERAPSFELLISELVYREAAAGDPEAAADRLAAVAQYGILTITAEASALAEVLVTSGPIPREYAEDALHIAIAAVNGMDYLLTWNCKHLANAFIRGRIEALVEDAGYTCPVICTPEELIEE